MELRTFKKKPVEVQAMQFTSETALKVREWLRENEVPHAYVCINLADCDAGHDLVIETLEGNMRANEGDFIIKGVNGEFYPCKPDIFEKTYEEVKPRWEGHEENCWLQQSQEVDARCTCGKDNGR